MKGIKKIFTDRKLLLVALVILITGLGWWAALWQGALADFEMRNQLLGEVTEIAMTIEPSLASMLTFTAEDISSPAFEQIRRQLFAYRRLKPDSPIYSVAIRDSRVVFGPESIVQERAENFRAGMVYNLPHEDLFKVFIDAKPTIVGPYTDEYSTAISALAPVVDPKTQQVIMVIGIDVGKEQWQSAISSARKSPIFATFLLLAIVFCGIGLMWYREKYHDKTKRTFQHIETILTATVCLLIAGYAVIVAWQITESRRRQNFNKVAAARAASIRDAFNEVDVNISSLGRFYELHDNITREIFYDFTRPMSNSAVVGAYKWVPSITYDRKVAYEQTLAEKGLDGFSIWQYNAIGQRQDVERRAAHYPITHISPLEGNASKLGFDLGSVDVFAKAIEKAGKSGLKTATDPIGVFSSSKSTLVFKPVFETLSGNSDRALTRIPAGFVAAELKIQKILENNIRINAAHSTLLNTDMLDVMDNKAVFVASSSNFSYDKLRVWDNRQYDLHQITPIFAFDRTFAIVSHPSDVFYAQNPPITVLIVSITGLAVSLILTLFVKFLRSRHSILENEVLLRTADIAEREQRLSITLNSIGDAVIATDTYGFINRMNPIAERLTGWTFDEAQGLPLKDVFKIYDASSLKEVQGPVDKVLETCEVVELSNHTALRSKKGKMYQIGHSASPIRAESGEVVGVVLVFRDVTEQYNMRKTIEEREAQFRTLANSGQALVWTSGLDRKFDYFNRPWLDFTNKTLEEELGYGWQKGLHPDDLPRWEQAYEKAFTSRRKISFDFRLLRYDGKYRWVQVNGTPRYDRFGKFIGFIGHCLDITARKNAEESLERSERRLLLATRGAGIGIWDYDVSADYLEWNEQMYDIYGVDRRKFGNKFADWCETIVDEDLPKFRVAFEAALKGEDEFNIEYHVRRWDNTIKYVKGIAVITWDEKGNPTRVVGVNYDTTELEKANAKLRRALEQAEEMAAKAQEANRAKGQFLANMSHEIRTPMNGVIGMTDLLLETELSDEQRRYAEIARSSGNSMLTLINEILDFSRIEADKLKLEMTDFDLHLLVEEVAEMLSFKAQEKNVELVCRIDPKLHTQVRSDYGRIKQILTNLGGNAIKFTEEGEIFIEVSQLIETDDKVKVEFCVSDTGIGIPKDKMGLLFNPFSQIDDTHTRRFSGTGLGLAISKSLTEMLGGKISCDSDEGKGSRFKFTIVCEKQPATSQDHRHLDSKLFDGLRVLIVDDNINNCNVLSEQLTIWGAKCQYCHNAIDVVDIAIDAKAKSQPFKLIIIDTQMPHISGCKIGKAIKKSPVLDGVKLIMMTAPGKTSSIELGTDGFEGYLPKPIRRDMLRRCVSKLLESDRVDCEPVKRKPISHTISIEPKKLEKAKVLLVEDNPINQKVAIGMLKKLGLNPDSVLNGQDAVKAVEKEYYDLIFMDVQMPVMDGYDATVHIRQLKTPAATKNDVPIIALTANAIKGDKEKCISAGMNDYIPKPVMLPVLAQMVNKWLK